MAITPTKQRNAVSQGIALGLALCDRSSLPFDKVRVDLAFASAWRHWPYRERFPQVGTDLSKGLDGARAMTRATEGKHVCALFWDRGGRELVIYACQEGWDPSDETDVEYALSVIDDDVPLDGWVALAREFLEHFDQ